MINPKVLIIIINYNGLDDTRECLISLRKITYNNFDVIVVDNNSKNNEAEILESEFSDFIKIIKDNKNLGFSGGNNLAINNSKAENYKYFLFLNNDTIVNPDFLEGMVSLGETDDKNGIIGGKIYFHGSNKQIYALGGGRANFYWDIFSYFGWKKNNYPEGKVKLDYVSGCCLLVKKSALQKIGNFDEKFFLYNEEVDLCLRATKAGFRLAWSPKTIIWHKSARSTRYLSRPYIYYMIRNKLLLAKKNALWYELILFIPVFIIKEILGYTLLLTIKGNLKAWPGIYDGVFDFFRKKFGKYPS